MFDTALGAMIGHAGGRVPDPTIYHITAPNPRTPTCHRSHVYIGMTCDFHVVVICWLLPDRPDGYPPGKLLELNDQVYIIRMLSLPNHDMDTYIIKKNTHTQKKNQYDLERSVPQSTF